MDHERAGVPVARLADELRAKVDPDRLACLARDVVVPPPIGPGRVVDVGAADDVQAIGLAGRLVLGETAVAVAVPVSKPINNDAATVPNRRIDIPPVAGELPPSGPMVAPWRRDPLTHYFS